MTVTVSTLTPSGSSSNWNQEEYGTLKRAAQIYRYIIFSFCTTGLAPTVKEIQHACSIRNQGTISYSLGRLEQQGWIIQRQGKARGITIPLLASNAQHTTSCLLLQQELLCSSPTHLLVGVRGQHYAEKHHICDGDFLLCQPFFQEDGAMLVAVHFPSDGQPDLRLVRVWQEESGSLLLQDLLLLEQSPKKKQILSMAAWQHNWFPLGTVLKILRSFS
jgi:hypothetical protein